MTTYSIYIDGVRCNVADNTVMAITYQLQDFRDLNLLRRRTVSKTFSVIGTDEINRLFASVWDIKFTSTQGFAYTYNQNKRKECVLYENDTPLLSGTVILESVVIENSVYKYNFKFLSNEIVKLKELEVFTLNQLTEFSKYNHVLNADNIIDTWDGYNYINNTRVQRPSGKGYIYPIGFYGSLTETAQNVSDVQPTNKFNCHKLVPAFCVAELFSECFKKVGIEATVNLPAWLWENLMISGDYEQLKRQISGISVEKNAITTISDDYVIEQYGLIASNSVYYYNYSNYIGNISTVEQLDEENNYNGNTYVATRKCDLKILIDYAELRTLSGNNYANETVHVSVLVNNSQVASHVLLHNSNVSSGSSTAQLEVTVSLNVGDVVTLKYTQAYVNYYQPMSIYTEITKLDVTYTAKYTSFVSGDTVNMLDWLPKMKALDFVSAVIKMFNLYISEVDQNTIHFETYDNFYEGWDTALNVYPYIDYGQPIEIKSLVLEQGVKSIKYRYSQPNDYCNKYLKDVYNFHWGEKHIEIDTDICTDEKTLEIPFSLVLLNEIEGYNIACPTIYDFKNNKYEPVSFKPFLFFFNGVMFEDVKLIDIINNSYYVTNVNRYPLISANYWDSNNNRISLYFEPPQYVLYQTGSVVETTKTIFNEYIAPDINNTTNYDSKLVKLAVSTDVFKKYNPNSLLRKLINIDGAVYKVNKIIDYNANKASVDVELIKVIVLRRDIVFPEPIVINDLKPIGQTTTLKTASLGGSGILLNELYADLDRKALCYGNIPITIAKGEFFGTISQSGKNDPTLSEIYKTMDVAFVREGIGVYRTTTTGYWFGIVLPNSKNQIIKIYMTDGYLYIDTDNDDELSNNLLYLIKLL